MRSPKTLSGKIDALWNCKNSLTEAVLQASQSPEGKLITKLEADIEQLEAELLEVYAKDETLTVTRGKRATVKLKKTETYTATDWPAVLKYIQKTKAWDMLTKRLSTVAIRERVQAGEKVPGVQHYEKRSIAITEIS